MKKYKHLSSSERDKIMVMLWENKSLGEIAKALGRDKSTISRELNKNSSSKYKKYLSHMAHQRAVGKRKNASKRQRLKNEKTLQYVTSKLKGGWSPEQIAGRISIDHPELSISHEAIYQYVYHPATKNRQELIQCLRRAHRKRKNKSIGRKQRKSKIPGRVPIELRPSLVEARAQFGQWEGDSLVSRKSKSALNSLVERKSRLLFLTKLERKTAEATRNAVVNRLKALPIHARRTLTLDNGTENTKHQEITSSVAIKCFFANPYASWERGTNENLNGLVRWYLPKGTDFRNISETEVARIESAINNRPRKCLGYKTPLEVASACVALRC